MSRFPSLAATLGLDADAKLQIDDSSDDDDDRGPYEVVCLKPRERASDVGAFWGAYPW